MRRYALGPSLGQCCGGVVHLKFEAVSRPTCRPRCRPAYRGRWHRWRCSAAAMGRALVRALQGPLPFAVRWIDSPRRNLSVRPATERGVRTSDPCRPPWLPLAPAPGADHELQPRRDLDVVAACLTRLRSHNDLPFVGLSRQPDQVGDLSPPAGGARIQRRRTGPALPPIGLPGIAGKQPEVIAVSVAAQLLQHSSKGTLNTMESHLLDWANLLLRWVHVITAIAWVGSSFYFVFLDSTSPAGGRRPEETGRERELWAVHGGGFYHPVKFAVSPPQLPRPLHWFYWESYSTWLSGFALFGVPTSGRQHLPDRQVAHGLGARGGHWRGAGLPGGVLAAVRRDLPALWPEEERRRHRRRAGAGAGVRGVLAGLPLVCRARAFLLVGAMIATAMSANVFFWIIPGQKKVIASIKAGEPVDPVHGQRGNSAACTTPTSRCRCCLPCSATTTASPTATRRTGWC